MVRRIGNLMTCNDIKGTSDIKFNVTKLLIINFFWINYI